MHHSAVEMIFLGRRHELYCGLEDYKNWNAGFEKCSEMETNIQMFSSAPSYSGDLAVYRYCSMESGRFEDVINLFRQAMAVSKSR